MASRIFDEPNDLYIGDGLTNGCIWAYENSPVGIMPETFTAFPCPDATGQQCSWDDDTWKTINPALKDCGEHCVGMYPPGFLEVRDESYLLRPEAIESVFVMYRVTGDEQWRDLGWMMFENIIRQTRTNYGHAALFSVIYTQRREEYEMGKLVLSDKAIQKDEMESFWLAETLKYFYLLFSEPSLISLDEWVLNTEAHPLRLTRDSRGF